MIPYIEIPALTIWGPIAIHPFGVLVVSGCVTGAFVARWHAGTRGLDLRHFPALLTWVLISGFVVSHLVALALYRPEGLRLDLNLLQIGKGMSSYGGFLGATFAAIIYLKRRGLALMEFIDALILGLVVGWFFGRLGCTIVHDHPGLPSDFFLAVKYPSGPRHDLGFYEWLFAVGLNLLLFSIRGRGLPAGVLTGVVCLLYAPFRFLTDFLRVTDRLYLGFTPGHYFSVALLLVGVAVLVSSFSSWRGRFGQRRP